MKKNLSKLIAATVATSAIVVPVSAFAAENVAEKGVYLSKAGEDSLYFTLPEWEKLVDNDGHIALTMTYGPENINVVFADKVANIKQLGAADGDFGEASASNKSATEVLAGEYTKTNGSKVTVGDGQEAGDLKVESVSAINETTVTVKLDKAPAKALTKDEFLAQFPVTGATVTAVAQGLTTDAYTLTVESLAGKTGTVTVGTKSTTYNYEAPEVAKAAVESVDFVNNRQLKVTYNTVVDYVTATNPANYYFELIEGEAGSKLGAADQTLTDSMRLSDMVVARTGGNTTTAATDWWTRDTVNTDYYANDKTKPVYDNIYATTVDGKTVVTINLPYDAMFDSPYASSTLVLKNPGSTVLKTLNEDTKLLVAVRNVKDAAGVRLIDTAVKEITIKDSVAPELVKVTDADGNEVDISKLVELYTTPAKKNVTKQVINFHFSEPIQANSVTDSENIPADVKVFVDGKEVTLTAVGAGNGDKEIDANHENYEASKVVTVNLQDLLTKATKTFNAGDQYNLKITGLKDLNNKLYTGAIDFNVKLKQRADAAVVTPEILNVEQIADNVFRVKTNRADVTGVLTIKGAATDGTTDVSAVMPLSKEVGNTGVYYSYVVVKAANDSNAPDVLSYEDKAYIKKDVTVTSVGALKADVDGLGGAEDNVAIEAKGLDYSKSQMTIAKDMSAPVLQSETEIAVKYNAGNDTLSLPFADTVPASWGEVSKAEGDWYKLRTLVEPNLTTDYTQTGRLSVAYTKQDGTLVNKYVDLTFATAGDNTAVSTLKVTNSNTNPAFVEYNATTGNYDLKLDLGNVPSLDSDFLVSSALPSNAEYKFELVDALLSDGYRAEAATFAESAEYDLAVTKTLLVPASVANTPLSVADYQTAYGTGTIAHLDLLDEAGTDTDVVRIAFVDGDSRTAAQHGYTTITNTITFKVGENTAIVKDEVPQTSKQLMSFDAATQELVVGITGAPTAASATNLDNYLLNGQTLKSLGATAADVTFADATTVNSIAVNKVVRIKLPKNSIAAAQPANFTVQDLVNEHGAKMTPVTTVVTGLTDNTAPKFTQGTDVAAGQLELRFNEPLKAVNGASAASMAQNFEVKVNGVAVTVSEVTLVDGENKFILNVGVSDLASATSIVVNVKANQDGKFQITDANNNALQAQTITVK